MRPHAKELDKKGNVKQEHESSRKVLLARLTYRVLGIVKKRTHGQTTFENCRQRTD